MSIGSPVGPQLVGDDFVDGLVDDVWLLGGLDYVQNNDTLARWGDVEICSTSEIRKCDILIIK